MSIRDSRRVLDSIRRLVRLLRLSDRAAERAVGLSGAQLFVLQQLGRTAAESLNELALRTLTDQSSVSVVVTRLVRAGLVSRERSVADGRRTELSITARGRTLLGKAPPVAQEMLLASIESLPDADSRRFAELFERILAAAGADDSSIPPMLFEDARSRRAGPQRARRSAAPRRGKAASK